MIRGRYLWLDLWPQRLRILRQNVLQIHFAFVVVWNVLGLFLIFFLLLQGPQTIPREMRLGYPGLSERGLKERIAGKNIVSVKKTPAPANDQEANRPKYEQAEAIFASLVENFVETANMSGRICSARRSRLMVAMLCRTLVP